MTQAVSGSEAFLKDCARIAESDPFPWLESTRQEAVARFEKMGFPTRKTEDWRYTNVGALTQAPFPQAASAQVDQGQLDSLDLPQFAGPRLVFINGHWSEELSDGPQLSGVRVAPLHHALTAARPELEKRLGQRNPTTPHAFGELNTALFTDGAFVHVEAGQEAQDAIQLLYLSVPTAERESCTIRNLIVVESGAKVSVVEMHAGLPGAGEGLINIVTEAFVDDDGSLDHYKLCFDAESAYHVSSVRAIQGNKSHFGNHFAALGGGLIRNDVEVVIDGENSHCDLNGVFVVDGTRHVDSNTLIHHAQPHCSSDERYKGVLGDKARGVFKGKIFVHEDAQKTDAEQSSSNLLLSDDAVINAQPNLEIYADDVRCTHGATVGQISDDALFYLRARGIRTKEARRILTMAFVNDVIERFPHDDVRNHLEEKASRHLERILA